MKKCWKKGRKKCCGTKNCERQLWINEKDMVEEETKVLFIRSELKRRINFWKYLFLYC